jgi:hypothetical protein
MESAPPAAFSDEFQAAARRRRSEIRKEYFRSEIQLALKAALTAWRKRRPWKWLPPSVQPFVFGKVGKRFAARFFADWMSEYRASNRAALQGILEPEEFTVHPPRSEVWLRQMKAAVEAELRVELRNRQTAPKPGPAGGSHVGIRVGYAPGCPCRGCREMSEWT